MPDMHAGKLFVTDDGGYRYLACFAADPGADRGDNIIEMDPGTAWEEILAAVRRHTCTFTAASDLDEQALDAAMAVFDRSMKLMAPHRVFVKEALMAAGQVYQADEAAEVEQMMHETDFISLDVPHGEPRFRLKIASDLASGMVRAFDELVHQVGCENYIEWESTLTDPATEQAIEAGLPDDQIPPLRKYKLIIVRPGGKTPHELRQEADQRLDRVHDQLTRIYDGDTDDFTTLESTVEYVVRSHRAIAAAEEEAADEIQRLRAALRDVVTGADTAHPSAEDALRTVRERAAAALAATAPAVGGVRA